MVDRARVASRRGGRWLGGVRLALGERRLRLRVGVRRMILTMPLNGLIYG